jgi:hypothetical protein
MVGTSAPPAGSTVQGPLAPGFRTLELQQIGVSPLWMETGFLGDLTSHPVWSWSSVCQLKKEPYADSVHFFPGLFPAGRCPWNSLPKCKEPAVASPLPLARPLRTGLCLSCV